MAELLPCPFCGESARAFQDQSRDVWFWTVTCDNPACGGNVPDDVSEAYAIDAWNKRKSDVDKMKLAFRRWLFDYETSMTGRWENLSIYECETLMDVQLAEFLKEFSDAARLPEQDQPE